MWLWPCSTSFSEFLRFYDWQFYKCLLVKCQIICTLKWLVTGCNGLYLKKAVKLVFFIVLAVSAGFLHSLYYQESNILFPIWGICTKICQHLLRKCQLSYSHKKIPNRFSSIRVFTCACAVKGMASICCCRYKASLPRFVRFVPRK